MKRAALLVLSVLMLGSLSGCGYNVMQANEEAVFAAWGDVEAAYQRRADLIPNLVEVVKGYARHEADNLKAVTEARAKVGSMQVSKQMVNDPRLQAGARAIGRRLEAEDGVVRAATLIDRL